MIPLWQSQGTDRECLPSHEQPAGGSQQPLLISWAPSKGNLYTDPSLPLSYLQSLIFPLQTNFMGLLGVSFPRLAAAGNPGFARDATSRLEGRERGKVMHCKKIDAPLNQQQPQSSFHLSEPQRLLNVCNR